MKTLVSIGLLIGCAISLMGNLGGCGTRDGVVVLPAEPPRLDRPDSDNMRECGLPAPVKTPGPLPADKTEGLLRTVTLLLLDCRGRHHGLIKFINDRDGGLTGTSNPTPAKK